VKQDLILYPLQQLAVAFALPKHVGEPAECSRAGMFHMYSAAQTTAGCCKAAQQSETAIAPEPTSVIVRSCNQAALGKEGEVGFS